MNKVKHVKKVSVSTLVITAFIAFGFGFLIREIQPGQAAIAVPQQLPVDVDASLKDGEHTVSRVIDGDTVELETGHRVRYAGIDAPEMYERYGTGAQKFNSSLVLGKRVRLEMSEDKPDLYGRALAFVWQGDIFVNKRMIEDGYATVLVYDKMRKPKYFEELTEAEEFSKSRGWGMWALTESK